MDHENAVDLRAICVDEIEYSISIIASDSLFTVVWQCPECEQNNEGTARVTRHAVAYEWAAAKVLMHHAEHHRTELPASNPTA